MMVLHLVTKSSPPFPIKAIYFFSDYVKVTLADPDGTIVTFEPWQISKIEDVPTPPKKT